MVRIGAVSDRDNASLEEFGSRPEAAKLDRLPQTPATPPSTMYPGHHLDVTSPLRPARTAHYRVPGLSPIQTSSSQAFVLPETYGHGKGKAKSVDSYDGLNMAETDTLERQGHQGEEEVISPMSYQGSEKDCINSIPRHALPHRHSIYHTPNESSEDLSDPEDHVFWLLASLAIRYKAQLDRRLINIHRSISQQYVH